jgi:hypothetical protein
MSASRPAVRVSAVLLAAVFDHAVLPEMASMVVGLAKCADCTRKNMNAEAVYNGAAHMLFCAAMSVRQAIW